jgi:hypothetical protein
VDICAHGISVSIKLFNNWNPDIPTLIGISAPGKKVYLLNAEEN